LFSVSKRYFFGIGKLVLILLFGILMFDIAARMTSDFDPDMAALGTRKFVNSYADGVQLTCPATQFIYFQF